MKACRAGSMGQVVVLQQHGVSTVGSPRGQTDTGSTMSYPPPISSAVGLMHCSGFSCPHPYPLHPYPSNPSPSATPSPWIKICPFSHPALFILQHPRPCLVSLLQSWLDHTSNVLHLKKNIIIAIVFLLIFFRLAYFDFAGVEEICFSLLGLLKFFCFARLFYSSQVS